MHLWPSSRLRDSFKHGYLKKLEWNLHLMKTQKKKNSQSQSETTSTSKLLDDDNNSGQETPNSKNSCFEGTLLIFRELTMIVSCCYCCFCCGACIDDEED